MISGTGTTDTLNSRSQQGKCNRATKPVHCGTVGCIPLFSQQRGEAFIEHRSLFAHASSSRQYNRYEGCSLHLSHSLFICPTLLILMLQIGRRQGGCLVGVGMWVKNSDVNKGPLKPAAPEAIHGHIETCPLSYISRSTREGGAHRGGLKVWFNLDVTAYLSEKIGCKIAYLIVTNRGKPTPGTGESMADGERSATVGISANNSNETINGPVDNTYLWFIIPQLLNGLSSLLVSMTVFEFICAQAPRTTQGLLIGLWYATFSIRYLLVGLVDTLLIEKTSWLIFEGVKVFLILVSLVLFSCVSRRYRYRQRDEIVNVQGMIEDTHDKWLDQEEEYMQEHRAILT